MSRPKTKTPKYSFHKASGQAVVRVDGHDVYLGKYDTPESHGEYARVIAEWRVRKRDAELKAQEESFISTPQRVGSKRSISELLLAYWKFAETYYIKDGSPTSELEGMRSVIKLLRELYGRTPAHDFGPLALKSVRQHMIDGGLCRTEINKRVGRIKRIFKWAVSEELIPPSVHQGLATVIGLRYGRTEARESAPVRPVARNHVDAVLPFVSRQVAAMIQLQALTGMRPGEVVQMRPCDIDRSKGVWIYRPADHKNRYRGHAREIPLGPKAQDLIAPFLSRADTAYFFSPAEAEAKRNEAKYGQTNAARKTRIYPSEMKARARRKTERAGRSEQRKRPPKDSYTRDSYRRAITYAIKRAQKKDPSVEHWHPHQLRHLRATEIRRDHGIEAAQVVLGHANADVTQIYAEKNLQTAIELAAKAG